MAAWVSGAFPGIGSRELTDGEIAATTFPPRPAGVGRIVIMLSRFHYYLRRVGFRSERFTANNSVPMAREVFA